MRQKGAEETTSADVTTPPKLTTSAEVLEIGSVVIYPKYVERSGCLKVSASNFFIAFTVIMKSL